MTAETRTVRTPCCDAPVSLSFETYRHGGAPRKADPRFESWTFTCPTCDAWLRCGIELRYRKRRMIEGSRWSRFETVAKLVGGPLFAAAFEVPA